MRPCFSMFMLSPHSITMHLLHHYLTQNNHKNASSGDKTVITNNLKTGHSWWVTMWTRMLLQVAQMVQGHGWDFQKNKSS